MKLKYPNCTPEEAQARWRMLTKLIADAWDRGEPPPVHPDIEDLREVDDCIESYCPEYMVEYASVIQREKQVAERQRAGLSPLAPPDTWWTQAPLKRWPWEDKLVILKDTWPNWAPADAEEYVRLRKVVTAAGEPRVSRAP